MASLEKQIEFYRQLSPDELLIMNAIALKTCFNHPGEIQTFIAIYGFCIY